MKNNKLIWLQLPSGAKIEKNFLIGNIEEAKNENNYKRVNHKDINPCGNSHSHCEICWKAISDFNDETTVNTAYYCNNTWVCEQCYKLFLKVKDINKSISKLEIIIED